MNELNLSQTKEERARCTKSKIGPVDLICFASGGWIRQLDLRQLRQLDFTKVKN